MLYPSLFSLMVLFFLFFLSLCVHLVLSYHRNKSFFSCVLSSKSFNWLQIAVHLWVTGEGCLASHSFLVIKHVASVFRSDCFNSCLIKTYKAFIGHCKFVDPVSSKHIQFLRNSFIELCSQDVPNSSSKAMVCVEQLAKILQMGLRAKKKVCDAHVFAVSFNSVRLDWHYFIAP